MLHAIVHGRLIAMTSVYVLYTLYYYYEIVRVLQQKF